MPRPQTPAEVRIVPYDEAYFPALQALCQAEGWTSFVERPAEARQALKQAQIAWVALRGDRVLGYVRALTDGCLTTYLAEILVATEARGQGVGALLLEACHQAAPRARIDLLSTEDADGFYEALGFRPFPGFRKSYV